MRSHAIKSATTSAFGHAAPAAVRTMHRTPIVRALLRGPQVQPKLTIGAVNDPAEREADQVAGEVMRMPDRDMAAGAIDPPPTARPDGIVRRQAASTGGTPAAATPTAKMPSLTHPFVIHLKNIGSISLSYVTEAMIRDTYAPIAKAAGRELRLNRIEKESHLKVEFISGKDPESPDVQGQHQRYPCKGGTQYGNQGLATVLIYVDAHADMRVCHGPRGGPEEPDFTSQLVRVFDRDDVDFARAIGNTVIHELRHMIAGLPHSDERRNYMYTLESGSDLPYQERSRQTVRRHASQNMVFSADEIQRLQESIRVGNFIGLEENDIGTRPPAPNELIETPKTLRHGKKP